MGHHEKPSFPVTIRRFRDGEAGALHQVFFKTVREGTGEFYSEVQRRAWAANSRMPTRWIKRLADQFTVVATIEGRIVGFMSMAANGYVDLAYVLPHHKGLGIGSRLYEEIEAEARNRALTILTTEASHLARPFFKRQGWTEVAKQQVERLGITLENFRMEKLL